MKKITLPHVLFALCSALRAQPFIVPVVFHVMYAMPAQNIPDSAMQQQLDVLNEDYNALNSDTWKVPAVWQPLIGNMNITFVLASLDPQGNPTNGIERQSYSGSYLNWRNSAMGGLDAWPDTSYLNIWVGNLTSQTGLLAWASFPGDPTWDGMCIDYHVVGRGTYLQAPYDHGRTATHELAHWFGVRHLWSNDTLCPNADSIADTPDQFYYTVGGYPPGTILTDGCLPTAPGKMWMNFLDYTDDTSMYFFTQGQVAKMTYTMNNWRTGFLTPDGIDGIHEQQTPEAFSIYPTPSIDGIFSVRRNDASGDMRAEVYDLGGRLVYQPEPSAASTMPLDLSSLAEGVYTVVLRTQNAVESKRVVIAR